jgi:hypothetical protein
MDAETREMLKEIQETQIIILSKLFHIEAQLDSGRTGKTPADYTQEARSYIKTLREHVEINQRRI